MKTYEYFPTLFYSENKGLLNGIVIVLSFVALLFVIWSICSLSGGYLGAVRGMYES